MNRREFVRLAGAGVAVGAALRAGRLDAAEQAAVETAAGGLATWIYNAREYGVRGDGVTDDSDAIDALFVRANEEHRSGQIAYFFPAGRYLCSRPLYTFYWVNNKGPINYGHKIVGQGPTQTQFVLKSRAKGFEDPDVPRVFFGAHRNVLNGESFAQTAEGFAVLANQDSTNPAAVAMLWIQHFGISRDLLVMGGYAGFVSMVFHGSVENLQCVGGQYGIVQRQTGCSFTNTACSGFSKAGLVANMGIGTLTLNGLYTRGRGLALDARAGSTSVTGAWFEAEPPGGPAVRVTDTAGCSLVNFTTVGYDEMVAGDVKAAGRISTLTLYASPERPDRKSV